MTPHYMVLEHMKTPSQIAFEKRVRVIEKQISDLVTDYFQCDTLSQEQFFVDLTKLDRMLCSNSDWLDDIAFHADSYYAQQRQRS